VEEILRCGGSKSAIESSALDREVLFIEGIMVPVSAWFSVGCTKATPCAGTRGNVGLIVEGIALFDDRSIL